MYRNTFTGLIGVALLLACVHSVRVGVDRPIPASGFQSSTFNHTDADESTNLLNLSDGKNISGVGTSENKQGLFASKRFGDVKSVAKRTFPHWDFFPKVNIEGKGGDGNVQGQFGDHSTGVVDGGNGGKGVTINRNPGSPFWNFPSNVNIVGKGGNGNSQGQFGSNSFGTVRGGNGGDGGDISEKRSLRPADGDSTSDIEQTAGEDESGSDSSEIIKHVVGGSRTKPMKKQRIDDSEPTMPEGIDAIGGEGNSQLQADGQSTLTVEGGEGGAGLQMAKGTPTKLSHNAHIKAQGGKGNAQGQTSGKAVGKVTGGGGGKGISYARKRRFSFPSDVNIEGHGGNGNAQGQFGDGSNGDEVDGNGVTIGANSLAKRRFISSNFDSTSDSQDEDQSGVESSNIISNEDGGRVSKVIQKQRNPVPMVDPPRNIEGKGGQGNDQGQFGDRSKGNVIGGNGGDGVTIGR